jgi:hypothetical protein
MAQRPVYIMQVYTKAEEERAKRAYELVRNSGYPSYQEVIHLVEDGNIAQLPELTAEDVCRAYDLYGNPPEYTHGKMVKKKASRAHGSEEADIILRCHAHRRCQVFSHCM